MLSSYRSTRVDLSTPLHGLLRAYCECEGVTMVELVEEAIAQALYDRLTRRRGGIERIMEQYRNPNHDIQGGWREVLRIVRPNREEKPPCSPQA